MSTPLKVSAAAGIALLLAAPAMAQEGGATEEEVRSFFDGMVAEAEDAAESGDWRRAGEWMQRQFAAEASLAVEGVVMSGGGPVFTYAATLDGDDIARFTAVAMSALETLGADALESYSITADVRHAEALPNGEASATVEFRETAAIDRTAIADLVQEDAAERQGGDAPPIALQSTASCEFRLAEGDGGLRIELAACRTTTTF